MKDKDITNKIAEYLEAYTKLWAFSGTIAAIKNGEVLFNKAYGYANIEHKVKNTTKTKYKIWSLTKQFTAVAILMLEEKSLLKVEDPLKKYFPECEGLNPLITIHQLLTHTSGIFNYSNLPNSRRTFQRIHHGKTDLIDMFTKKPLDFEPGAQWNYSNTGYYLLGILIEKLTGMTYSEFLSESIFKPLKMFNTGVDDEKSIIDNKATGYYLNGDDLIHCQYINMNLIFSSGAMYSTSEDLLLWSEALNSNQLISRESITKMNTPYKNNYGYGVAIHSYSNKRVVQHNGGCEGFLAEIHRFVDNDFTVVVLSNYGFTAVNKLCKIIADIAFGDKYELPIKPSLFPLASERIDCYLGVYEEKDFHIELKKEGNHLSIVINNEFILPVYPISESVLHHTWIDEEYSFTNDDNGDVYLWGMKKKKIT